MKKCESCGKVYSDGKDVFCPHCGAVASKKCTHGSSFDSSRWDRGEIYRNNENTYSSGSEPHAQRAGYNSDYDSGNNYEPKKTPGFPLDLPGMLNGDKLKKIVGAIVAVATVLPIIISFFGGMTDFDTDTDWYGDNYYGTEEDENIAFVSEATVVTKEYGTDWFVFDLDIKDIYIDGVDMGFTDTLYINGFEAEIDLITYDMDDVNPGEYFYLDSYYSTGTYNYTGEQVDSSGYIDFSSFDFEYGEFIFISRLCLHNLYGEITVKLPFDAFSCDSDGNVIYYCYNNDNSCFEECTPETEIDDYVRAYSFSEPTEVVSEVYEDASETIESRGELPEEVTIIFNDYEEA